MRRKIKYNLQNIKCLEKKDKGKEKCNVSITNILEKYILLSFIYNNENNYFVVTIDRYNILHCVYAACMCGQEIIYRVSQYV